MKPNLALVAAIRDRLEAAGDPIKARRMQAYMKSEMPYRGVPSPARRAIEREVFAAHSLSSYEEWFDTILALWRDAGHREERYCAVELTGLRRYSAHRRMETLPLYEEMIVSGAWWDHVDAVAVHLVGDLLRRRPARMRPVIHAWSVSPDLWLRRAAIISQVTSRRDTDFRLLCAVIQPNLGDRDFFIRKAIGWALRSYAWVDPDAVRTYVEDLGPSINPLSRTEALKNIG